MRYSRQTLIAYIKTTIVLLVMVCSLIGCSKSQTSTLEGYIEGEYIFLSSSQSGILTDLFVSRGSWLKRGQSVFILDQKPEIDELRSAQHQLTQEIETLANLLKGQRPDQIAAIKAQRAQAEAELVFAKLTLFRYQALYKKQAIDKAKVDEAQSNNTNNLQRVNEIEANLREAQLGAREDLIKAQRATVKAAKASVAQAQWKLEQKKMAAPTDSLVFDTYFKVGEFVPPNQAVASLLAPENVKAIFFVPERLLSRMQLGGKVRIGCDSCKKSYTATISFISPEAEYTPPVILTQDSREKLVYRVEAALKTADAKVLHPGQPIDVTLTLYSGRS